jgi:phospholipid transport system substrate-binding protein
MNRPHALLLAATLATAAAAPAVAASAEGGPGSPTAQIKASNDRAQHLIRQRKKGALEDKKCTDELHGIVSGYLDYGELARRALASHWEGLSKAQREDFVKTFRELIEKNYVKQLKSNLEWEMVYKGEEVNGEQASVSTEVKAKTTGKSTDIAIDYKMRRVGAKWMVYDVITDETSMVQNYRSQFHKIITQEGFDSLMRKMRNKIAKSAEGDSGGTNSNGGAAQLSDEGGKARGDAGK